MTQDWPHKLDGEGRMVPMNSYEAGRRYCAEKEAIAFTVHNRWGRYLMVECADEIDARAIERGALAKGGKQ